MTAIEIKDRLHRMVVETDDVDVLEQIALLFSALRGDESLWDSIGEAEKAQIKRGLEELRAGRTKSHEEVRAKVRAFFAQRQIER
jgi:predicted transcriptional regulator